jgi:hypothetical protein
MPGTLTRSADYRLEAIDNGGLFRINGFPEGLPNVSMHIQAQRPAATITPYKTSDGRGYCTPKSVWIEDGEGSVIEERSDHVRPWRAMSERLSGISCNGMGIQEWRKHAMRRRRSPRFFPVPASVLSTCRTASSSNGSATGTVAQAFSLCGKRASRLLNR